jgi:Tetratricopeptide repeat
MIMRLNGKLNGAADSTQTLLSFSFCFILFCCEPCALGQTSLLSLDEYLRQARQSERQGDYVGAERLYMEAVERFPNQPELLKRLGIADCTFLLS